MNKAVQRGHCLGCGPLSVYLSLSLTPTHTHTALFTSAPCIGARFSVQGEIETESERERG